MVLPQECYVLSEIFVIVRRFSQTLQAHKLNMIKREKLARHPRTIWQIWACDVMPTSRIGIGGVGTPSVLQGYSFSELLGRLPETCWLKSQWAPKKWGLNSISGAGHGWFHRSVSAYPDGIPRSTAVPRLLYHMCTQPQSMHTQSGHAIKDRNI